MKLIGTLTSPYVRKVRIVLAEKKIDYDFEIDSPLDADSKVSQINPVGKIPVLLPDDETPLFDSRVIVEYIDKVTPNNKLLPLPNRERTEVKRWEAVADGLLDAATTIIHEKRRPKKEQSATWITRQQAKILRTLEFMSQELGDQPFCMGTHFSLADVAVGAALGYLTFRFADLDWKTDYPNLSRLYDKLMQRPSFADTVPQE